MSSCCGGKCGCGPGCKCGSGCVGSEMCPDISMEQSTTTETLKMGVVPQTSHFEASEMGVAAASGCKCGDNCTCNPCKCGK
ncbi:hypothetical protein ACE6H2_021509 [Prunus campanulata]